MAGINDLAKRVAVESDITQAEARRVIESTFNEITEMLVEGEDVRVAGFGSFVTVDKKATTARNPQTGASVPVPKKRVVKFKVSSGLKDLVKPLDLDLDLD